MIYLSLGSNLGDRFRSLSDARRMLEERIGVNMICSSIIETDPVGFESSDKFLNQVIGFEKPDDLSPISLLDICQETEIALGRAAHSAEFNSDGTRLYRSRIIDIDILLFDDVTMDTPRLAIPHRDMANRPFVMVPLMELL